MGENTIYSSFMMLTEHLYSVFAQYIISGRTRAPPETELTEMLPTFQFGAKTDRRALQSKFKSWAKRMNFENGHLTLISSGKIVIPKEKCDELIMHLHSKEHCNVDIIISQIQMTYSWTKKNFGMDRDVVVESIIRNCTMDECHKKISLEVAACSGHLDPDIQGTSSYPCRWPFPLPVQPTENPFQIPIPFINGVRNWKKAIGGSGQAKNISLPISKHTISSTNEDQEVVLPRVLFDARSEKRLPVRFKKPRNVYEYNSLMEAARLRPSEYPNVLKSEKVQFLSKLGIAPKSICSSRTMKKFRQELRKKKLMTRNCIIYRERKVLRDRNKLKKGSQEKRKHCYLGLPTKRSGTFSLERKRKGSFLLKFSRKLMRFKKEKSRKKGTSLESNPEPIEVIDIVTSEDEMQEANTLSENEEIETENNAHKLPATMSNISQDTMEDKNSHRDGAYKLPNETPQTESHYNENAPLYSHKQLIAQRILLPKMGNHDNFQVNTILTPKIALPIKRQPAPKIVGSPKLPASSFLFPRVSPVPASFLPRTQVLTPPPPRIIYPIHVPRSTDAKVFFINKEQRGAFIIIPPYQRPILPRNSQVTETKRTSSDKDQAITSPTLSTTQTPWSTTYKTSAVNVLGNGDNEKNDMQEEMTKILKWIYRMKSNLNPCMFKHGLEKSVQKLISQLNVGIYLVREAKKSLEEIESCVESRRLSSIKIK